MRIAIVNDTLMALESLKRIIESAPQHEIAWLAENGEVAVNKCKYDTPDLILMDLIMPVMNGVDACKHITQESPCAILVVTSSISENSALVFSAMGEGALDAVNTPVLDPNHPEYSADDLLKKISVIEKLIFSKKPVLNKNDVPSNKRTGIRNKKILLAIGSSTGGPSALASVLKDLPADFPAAIVVAQHIDQNFCPSFATWLDEQTQLPTRLAKEGDKPLVGHILISVGNKHLKLNEGQYFSYSDEPVDYPYRPSVNVLFNSIATHWQGEAYGALLTGMGKDGAEGLLALKQQGFPTIAQDEASCAVYGMPKEAAKINAAKYVLPLTDISGKLIEDLNLNYSSINAG